METINKPKIFGVFNLLKIDLYKNTPITTKEAYSPMKFPKKRSFIKRRTRFKYKLEKSITKATARKETVSKKGILLLIAISKSRSTK